MSWGALKHNSCPRCKGTMGRDRDRFGIFLNCLQCGHIIDLKTVPLITSDELVAKMKKRTEISLKQKSAESANAA